MDHNDNYLEGSHDKISFIHETNAIQQLLQPPILCTPAGLCPPNLILNGLQGLVPTSQHLHSWNLGSWKPFSFCLTCDDSGNYNGYYNMPAWARWMPREKEWKANGIFLGIILNVLKYQLQYNRKWAAATKKNKYSLNKESSHSIFQKERERVLLMPISLWRWTSLLIRCWIVLPSFSF